METRQSISTSSYLDPRLMPDYLDVKLSVIPAELPGSTPAGRLTGGTPSIHIRPGAGSPAAVTIWGSIAAREVLAAKG